MAEQKVRPPAVAGTFYPARAQQLQQMVRQFVETAVAPPTPIPAPKALIAPHAGYVYSGPIAGAAYATLNPTAPITRVVLLGPAHTVHLRGLALPAATTFVTPLGEVPVDQAAARRILFLPQVRQMEEAHAREHGLEVHLPFLQTVLPDPFQLLPLVVGDTTPDDVMEVLDMVWGGTETLIVISSDLSHYYAYEQARRLDTATAQAIESMNPNAIAPEQACGRLPIQGLLTLAKIFNLSVSTLDLRNSGDTAGPKERVVGYGAWAFWEPATA